MSEGSLHSFGTSSSTESTENLGLGRSGKDLSKLPSYPSAALLFGRDAGRHASLTERPNLTNRKGGWKARRELWWGLLLDCTMLAPPT